MASRAANAPRAARVTRSNSRPASRTRLVFRGVLRSPTTTARSAAPRPQALAALPPPTVAVPRAFRTRPAGSRRSSARRRARASRPVARAARPRTAAQASPARSSQALPRASAAAPSSRMAASAMMAVGPCCRTEARPAMAACARSTARRARKQVIAARACLVPMQRATSRKGAECTHVPVSRPSGLGRRRASSAQSYAFAEPRSQPLRGRARPYVWIERDREVLAREARLCDDVAVGASTDDHARLARQWDRAHAGLAAHDEPRRPALAARVTSGEVGRHDSRLK